MTHVSICTSMADLSVDFPELFNSDPDTSDFKRGRLMSWSGNNTVYSSDGMKSMKILSSLDGLEEMAEKGYIIITSYEEILGYRRQVEIDGELQWDEPSIDVKPAYTPQVIVGYEDGDPIYKVVRHDKQKIAIRMSDYYGNEFEEPTPVPVIKISYTYTDDGEIDETIETPVMELDYYETTDEIEGHQQVPVYGPKQEWVSPVMVDSGEVDELGSPVYVESVPGYYQDVVIPEQTITTQVPVMEEVPGDPDLKAIYDEIYPRTPTTDEDGNTHVPPLLFAAPGGKDMSHILGATDGHE
jgi:hypothetical protein